MRKTIQISIVLILIGFVIITTNCFRSKNPLGSDNEIRVIADSTIWQQAEPILRDIFEKIEYTPQPEKVFKVLKGDPGNFKRFKNIIFMSTLDAEDDLSKSINSKLEDEARSKVESGNIIFLKKEQWVKSQVVMFLIGQDLSSLLNKIEEQTAEIFFLFDDYWKNFHKDILYSYKEQVDVEQHLLKTYGWMIRVPSDFRLEVQSAKDRFVMFHRKIPPRWLAVYWKEATDPNIITKEWCISSRNEIGKKFYNNELVEEIAEPVIANEIVFLNRRALKLKGLWKTDDKDEPAGGPFRMYCFFDEPTERIYFIDMHVFAPAFKKGKLHYLRQMEIISHTFKTNLEK